MLQHKRPPLFNHQEARITAHGPSNADHGPLSLKCVSIVSELRQDLGVAAVSRCSFNAILGVAMVSRFASKCRDSCQSVAGRLESFYYRAHIAPKCDILSTIATPSRHFFPYRDTFATPWVSRSFGQLSGLYQCF